MAFGLGFSFRRRAATVLPEPRHRNDADRRRTKRQKAARKANRRR